MLLVPIDVGDTNVKEERGRKVYVQGAAGNLKNHHSTRVKYIYNKGPGLRHQGLKETELVPTVGDLGHEMK